MTKITNPILLTDLYELTMAAVYHEQKKTAPATFSLTIRDYPPHRGFFVTAGLNEVLDYLADLHFEEEDLTYLNETGLFTAGFLEFLRNFHFSGEVRAVPEGRLCFAQEPLLEITAPLIEAQLVETYVINAVGIQTMIATKAARCTLAARHRPLVDFSLRRTHGGDAGMQVARASYIGGFIGTSNVLAGKIYGLPIYGTMAHSFITAFGDELQAFRAYARAFPENTILLVDTYDTLEGVRHAARVGREMAERGDRLAGIRLDSGDMVELSRESRKILDRAGLKETRIFASGSFDEYKLERFMKAGASIDSFGVGTKMGVSADAPYLNMIYKLAEYDGRPMLKLSPGKINLPSRKQVFRRRDEQGRLSGDLIGLAHERVPGAEPLLLPVMAEGKIIGPSPGLPSIRKTCLDEIARLPKAFTDITEPGRYQVEHTPALEALRTALIHRLRSGIPTR